MEAVHGSTLAPAKVNLALRVVGRRPDGYHLLDSIVVPISLYDTVEVRAQILPGAHSRITLACESAGIPTGSENLAWRAADLFAQRLGKAISAEIRLSKLIPVGGGLGGGSSDAAAVLLLLNRLVGSPLARTTLADLGSRLGADVPFFVVGRPARITGIGERIEVLSGLPVLRLVLCTDGFPMSTAAVYARARLSLTKTTQGSNMAAFVGGRKPISDLLVNDLEVPAAEIHAGVLRLKSKLLELGARGALMSGSGSVVFGIWPEAEAASVAVRTLREQGLWAEAVSTLTASPLAGN